MRYAVALPDGTVVANSDITFMHRLCTARGIPESAIVLTDNSPEAANLRNTSKVAIDSLANDVYSIYVPSAGLLKEYQQAEDDAKAYMANPAIVPQSITSWAVPKGWTNEQAAQDILLSAAKLRYVMSKIREVRLMFKSLIDSAAGMPEINAVTQTGIATLNKLKG